MYRLGHGNPQLPGQGAPGRCERRADTSAVHRAVGTRDQFPFLEPAHEPCDSAGTEGHGVDELVHPRGAAVLVAQESEEHGELAHTQIAPLPQGRAHCCLESAVQRRDGLPAGLERAW